MLIDALSYAIDKSGALEDIYQRLDGGQDATLGIASSARPFIAAARFAHKRETTFIVVPGEEGAAAFARTLSAYLGEENVLHFPARSDFPFVPKKASPREVANRSAAAWALYRGEEKVVVASGAAMVRLMPPVQAQVYAPLICDVGSEVVDAASGELLEFDDFVAALVDCGYENTGELDGAGTFCIRGGLVDVFPGNSVFPIRIDFFGDEIDEIRRIVPSTGQTITTLDSFTIFPVREYRISKRGYARALEAVEKRAPHDPVWREMLDNLQGGADFLGADALLPYLYTKTSTLGDYVSGDALTLIDEPRSVFDDATHAYEDACSRSKGSHIEVAGLYAPPAKLSFGTGVRFTMVSLMRVGGTVDVELPVKRTDIAGDPDKLYGRLRGLVDQHYTVVFSASNYRAREDMKLAFVDHALPINEVLDARGDVVDRLKRGVVNIVDVDVPLGMIIPKAKLGIVSIHDTQGRSSSIRNRRRVDMTEITFPYKPGDYVVHAAHGIALFKDLVRQDIGGVMRDYLLLEYAEKDKLYVPVEQLDRVTRYVGPEGSSPRLTRLNTSDWSRALSKARKATKLLAFDLVDVYARRASVQGFRYSEDTPWQVQMEEDFPYEETPDQLSAIAEVKADMQSAKPMDRLVCGDVGFGKTEVALRAAFKAVQDKKQVMVLCPTTILAQQHYSTFYDRFEPYGVKVEILSRFRDAAQQKKALEGFDDGSVDVLVGTHRLLSRDVNPHDLGLVIIDEEQRFGVGHKEQMKNLREHIDVLTLSATPIPRTMQMSLSGVRDMSLILTPPESRRPIDVYVGEWDVDIVSGAIRREMQRKGQVYYVSNRVRTIQDAVNRVGEAAAEARIGIAHGQMSKEELERVMEDFNAGEIDVLVATTIIESGIDNPHTNTLIIEDAQRLGLAQMYQLKGRVGRSSAQAYAYFMFPSDAALTEEATARLEAINEHRDLGSGMRIAMRDLEIRGAGSMLGAEQSGNMSAVGFDLFAQMLSTAVNSSRENGTVSDTGLPPALSDITVNIPAHTYLPEEYMPDTDERVMMYRRIACAESITVVDELEQQLTEAKGEMPQAAKNMFLKARIRAWANENRVRTITVVSGRLTVEPLEVPRDKMIPIRRYGGRYVSQSKKLIVPTKYFGDVEDGLMMAIWQFLKEFK